MQILMLLVICGGLTQKFIAKILGSTKILENLGVKPCLENLGENLGVKPCLLLDRQLARPDPKIMKSCKIMTPKSLVGREYSIKIHRDDNS